MSVTDMWYEEKFQDVYGMRYRLKKTLMSQKSEFQQVDVIETAAHGKMLMNDGLVMVTERDEFIYHDMISHVPLFVHPDPQKVLIIGGGDGGTAREVLRHKNIVKCVMVEIDKVVVDACREHIPLTASVLSNPKLELRIEDGVKYMAETEEKFDVILIDSTDPIGPAAPLFGPEFYANVARCLTDSGIVVSQAESPFYFLETQNEMLKVLKNQFARLHIYNFTNMTYPGGFWSFSFATKNKDLCPIRSFQKKRYESFGDEFKYYNSGIHQAAFHLPQFQKKMHSGLLTELGTL